MTAMNTIIWNAIVRSADGTFYCFQEMEYETIAKD